jgi:hypothetical protein
MPGWKGRTASIIHTDTCCQRKCDACKCSKVKDIKDIEDIINAKKEYKTHKEAGLCDNPVTRCSTCPE